ncbi:MAG: YIP1 family protein [Crenarchaeota archaeon]|nr:YIP1 family protein [Thermoproteota archaeon]
MLDYLGIMYTSPKKSIQILLAERRSVIMGLAIVLVSSLINGLNLAYLVMVKGLSVIGLRIPFVIGASVIGIVMSNILIGVAAWLLIGGMIYLFDKILQGRGSFEAVLIAYSYQWLPLLITGLIAPAYYFLDAITGIVLYFFVNLIAFVWGFIYVLITNAEANKFSLGKSFAATIIAFIIVLVVIGSASIFLGGVM